MYFTFFEPTTEGYSVSTSLLIKNIIYYKKYVLRYQVHVPPQMTTRYILSYIILMAVDKFSSIKNYNYPAKLIYKYL